MPKRVSSKSSQPSLPLKKPSRSFTGSGLLMSAADLNQPTSSKPLVPLTPLTPPPSPTAGPSTPQPSALQAQKAKSWKNVLSKTKARAKTVLRKTIGKRGKEVCLYKHGENKICVDFRSEDGDKGIQLSSDGLYTLSYILSAMRSNLQQAKDEKWRIGDEDTVFAAVTSYRGRYYGEVREYYPDPDNPDQMRPGRNGVTLNLEEVDSLAFQMSTFEEWVDLLKRGPNVTICDAVSGKKCEYTLIEWGEDEYANTGSILILEEMRIFSSEETDLKEALEQNLEDRRRIRNELKHQQQLEAEIKDRNRYLIMLASVFLELEDTCDPDGTETALASLTLKNNKLGMIYTLAGIKLDIPIYSPGKNLEAVQSDGLDELKDLIDGRIKGEIRAYIEVVRGIRVDVL
jgi:hypothetical protein